MVNMIAMHNDRRIAFDYEPPQEASLISNELVFVKWFEMKGMRQFHHFHLLASYMVYYHNIIDVQCFSLSPPKMNDEGVLVQPEW